MMKIKAWLLIASMLTLTIFSAIHFSRAQTLPEVDIVNADLLPELIPEWVCDPYDPVEPPGRTYLNVSVYVKGTILGLSAWDMIVRWDPTYLTTDESLVYFTGVLGDTYDSVRVSSAGDWVMLGQARTATPGVDVTNTTLAWILLEVKYPGRSNIWIDFAAFYDDDLNPIEVGISTGAGSPGYWQSHKPVPVFYHNASSHTLPSKTCKIDCHTIALGDVVMFNATASWDPDGDAIVSYWFDFGDGTNSTSTGQTGPVQYHVYTNYSKTPYHPFVKITDATGKSWQSNWYEQKPEHDVQIWRDVSICDIWPTLDILDNVHYWWNWTALQNEEYVLGKYGGILVTLVNDGSITEYVHVELFAVRVTTISGFRAGEFVMDGTCEFYPIEEWLYEVGPHGGSAFDLFAVWSPPKKGIYVLVAKVDVVPCTHEGIGAGIDDWYGMSFWENIWWGVPNGWTEWADPTYNNLYVMPKPIFVFDSAEEYATWYADVDKDGIVFLKDLTLWKKVWYHSYTP